MALLGEVRWFPGGPAVVAEARAATPGTAAGVVALRAHGFRTESDDVETVSRQRLRVVQASGEWTEDNLGALLNRVYELPRVAVIAHVDTGEFGAYDTPERAFRDFLDGGIPPLWTSTDSGTRFVLFGGTITTEAGTVVSVVDTEHGVHLQTLARCASALRHKEKPGGLLLVVHTTAVERAAGLVTSSGLETA